MDEKTQIQGDSKEGAEVNVGNGSEPKTTSLVDDANTAAERLETANRKKEELLAREEQLMAKRILGGKSEGVGQVENKELTPKEYTALVMKGKIPPL